jgi:microcystin-dependent protein
MDQAYIGTIFMFTGNFAPLNWQFCDGSLLSIAENQALYAIIGTTYGGDGVNTFAVPDLRGTMALSSGLARSGSNYGLGQRGGNESVSLTLAQLPAHNHAVSVPVTDAAPSFDAPAGQILAAQSVGTYAPVSTADGSYGGVSCANTGSNQPISISSPFETINYIICMYGIFPPHN